MRMLVQFTEFGEPCGEGSVKLSSYLGPLVREHVPIVIDDWKKIGEELKTVLWESVKIRFEVEGEYEKAAVMKHMGCLWRASKSRLVKKIRKAQNNVERMKLRPDNISTAEWRKFVKENTSQEFKAVSDSYKERRRKQIPHTCSRRGMVRLAEDLRKQSLDEVTRMDVWVKSRTKKDGTTVNIDAASKIEMANEFIRSDPPSSSSSNPKEDTLSKILGPDNPIRLRAMGRGMSVTKLACFQMKSKYVTQMEQNQFQLQQQVNELQDALGKLNSPRQFSDVGEHSVPRSTQSQVHTPAAPMKSSKPLSQSSSGFSQHFSQQDTSPKQIVKEDQKCRLLDITGQKRVVAEGRWSSNSPEQLVHFVPLGHNAVRVWIDVVKVPDAKVWRPNYEIEVGACYWYHSSMA